MSEAEATMDMGMESRQFSAGVYLDQKSQQLERNLSSQGILVGTREMCSKVRGYVQDKLIFAAGYHTYTEAIAIRAVYEMARDVMGTKQTNKGEAK
jgi:sulfur relay (sulfurtransferase) complex TusBCD TusD component (DsrE family)